MHLTRGELVSRIEALAPPPRDAGRVVLVVARPDANVRETPARAKLTPDGGLEGDRWAKRLLKTVEAQVTLMRADVAAVFADGQPLSIFGDNLLVELDLSTSNLPAGTRLRIGGALCEVTSKPHTGCSKFEARVGKDARALTLDDAFADHRLRGIHVRVLLAGEVAPGDAIDVERRA